MAIDSYRKMIAICKEDVNECSKWVIRECAINDNDTVTRKTVTKSINGEASRRRKEESAQMVTFIDPSHQFCLTDPSPR